MHRRKFPRVLICLVGFAALLAWSPDGHTLASAHQDGYVRLWDAPDGQLVQEIAAHKGWVRGVAWSPDGRVIASTGEDKRAILRDAETGQWLTYVTHNRYPVWSVAWSPDGTKVATGSGVYDDVRPGVAIVWSVER